MRQLLNDKDLAGKIGAAGRRTATKNFNIKRFITDWEQLFRKVVSGSTIRSIERILE